MPVKRKTARPKVQKPRGGAAGLDGSFREFARKLRTTSPPLKIFKACALADEFPAAHSWQEVREFLVRSGAEHEAIVGARMAWREFRSKSV